MQVGGDELRALGLGCAVLGGGGGGDVDAAQFMAEEAIAAGGPVAVVSPSELPPDALVMPCGLVGAPTVVLERGWNGGEGAELRGVVEQLLGRDVAALMAFEVAGSNGLLPVYWASRLGLPIVDADGMGRALPELHQQAMHLAGLSASPLVLTDGRGNTIVIRATGNLRAERLARRATASLGGACAGALFCMSAAKASEAANRGALSRAIEIGAAMDVEPGQRAQAFGHALPGSVRLLDGKLTEIERQTSGGFVHGSVAVEGSGADEGRRLRLEFQNEILVALEEGLLVASVPDVINVLDEDLGLPIATERFRYGQRVAVVATPSSERWRSPAGLELVGPRAFGYELDYVALEERTRAR